MVFSKVRVGTFLGKHHDLGKLCSLCRKDDMRTPRPVKGVSDVETCFGVAVDLIVYVASVPAIYGRQWVSFQDEPSMVRIFGNQFGLSY
jgi:hypothetical protein